MAVGCFEWMDLWALNWEQPRGLGRARSVLRSTARFGSVLLEGVLRP